MISFLVKGLALLSLGLGIFIFFAAALRRFSHRGMAIAGIVYSIGGVLGLYTTSVVPPILAFVVAVGIRKFFGEPDYSTKKQEPKSQYQIWWETFRPLVGPTGEPMNYITVIERITDMTTREKLEYIKQKTESNLLWTVLNNEGKMTIKPGKHEGNVVAWWICDVPYPGNAQEVVFEKME